MNNVVPIWVSQLFTWSIILFLSLTAGQAQDSADSLLISLEESSEKDRLLLLNELVVLKLSEKENEEALQFAKQAEALAESLISADNQLIEESDKYFIPLTFLNLGQAYEQLEQYPESKAAYQKVLEEAGLFGAPELAQQAESAIEKIDKLTAGGKKKKKGFLGKVLKDLGASIDKTSEDFAIKANITLAEMYEDNDNYEKAIKKYTQAISQLRNKGDQEKVEELTQHIADLLEENVNIPATVEALADVKESKEKRNDVVGAASVQREMDKLNLRTEKIAVERPRMLQRIPENPEFAKREETSKNIRFRAERAERTKDYEASLNYYKQYLELEQTLAEQEKMQELALLEKAHQLDNQDKEIMLLKQNEEISQMELMQKQSELEEQLTFKRNMAIGLILLATLLLSLYLLYWNKKRDHKKLGVAFHSLEIAQDKLKTAEQKIKGLLHQQVSGAVANELLATEGEQIVQRKFVCVMFLDIRDFTPFVEKLSPEEIIQYQNNVLGFMIETVSKRKGIVNQIMGDGFMATFGAPVSAGNDCLEAYLAAQEIMQTVKKKSESGEIPPTRIGIGLHAGHVVAGNVGTRERKQYSITGNPVITAARLEQLNKEFGSTLVISKEVCDHLPEDIQCTMKFNPVMVKGRSEAVEVATF